MESEGMTNAELTALLETLAKLVEVTAKDPAASAKIVRDRKIKAQKQVADPQPRVPLPTYYGEPGALSQLPPY